MNLLEKAKKIEDWIIEIRRDIHMHPEASFEEVRTADLVEKNLRELGIEVQRLGKTGVVGLIKGAKPGKVIGLRADMDALSVEEKNDLEFKSQVSGMMHACGHDAHVAMLLGAAKLLVAEKENLCGTVKLIFQPAEEIAAGAKMMIQEGALQNPDVDRIFGVHIWPDATTGTAIVQGGLLMASGDMWTLTVNGVSAHGSMPWTGVDALTCSAAIVQSLQTVVSRNTDAREPVVVNIGTINGGERFNVIPGKIELTGMNRTFTHKTREELPKLMEQIIKNTCEAYRCTYDFKYNLICAPTINDEQVTADVRTALAPLFGAEQLLPCDKVMGSEDFSEYVAKIPGTFVFLGTGDSKATQKAMLHSNLFILDETALKYGSAAYAQVACEFLK